MVCKEEFLTWFKDLDSYKRIDMLCELINMCLPFELRFIGSYVEDTGKHTYQEFRQQSLFANDLEKLEKDSIFKTQSLRDEAVRHRVLLNISLLKSRNYSVANWYSKKFLRTDCIEDLVAKEDNEMVQNELLLLFTMASRHPAFSFDQKEFFSRILVQICDLRDSRILNRTSPYGCPPGFGYPLLHRKNLPADNTLLPINFAMHPPGIPHLDFVSHIRSWPGLHCGAPEVPPFLPQQPLQPPPPSASPLNCSPNQSRSTSPHRTPMVSRPLPLPLLTTPGPGTLPPAGLHAPSGGIPPTGIPQPSAPIPGPTGGHPATPPMLSIPAMLPVPLEALQPPQLSQSSQSSPMFKGQECDEINTTLKDEPANHGLHWMGVPATDIKPMNGLRLPFPPSNIRSSIADQMHCMTLTDDSSHYHSNSSSNSSPQQTPPDTPSNVPSAACTPHGPGRGPLDKGRTNGLPNFMPMVDTTSPPPPAFTFPAYAPLPPNRQMFYTNTTGFRPATASTAFPPFHHYPTTDSTSFPTYSFPYFSLMYSSYPPVPHTPHTPAPPRNPPGCYNCGAPSHVGQDCTQQNIDEITQKKNYRLDFSPVQSDGGEK